MTEIQIKYGPFACACPPHWGMTHVTTCDVVSRLEMVKKSTDADWLEAVIKHHATQKTVVKAAERRLRRLNVKLCGGATKGQEP